jgi:hypothetical protein
MRIVDQLGPWEVPAIAAALALGLALAGWKLRLAWLAGVAAGIGVLGGWWFGLGLLTASPRHLAERLPLLVLVLVLVAPLGGARRWLAWPALLAGALWAGWWMGGGPRWWPDMQRAAPAILGIAAATLLLARLPAPRWALPVAAAALLGGLLAAGLPGPHVMLAAALLAATAAFVIPSRGGDPALSALPVAGALAALAALTVLARGSPADWAAAAAPLAVVIGARFGPLGGGAAGGLALLAALALRA